VNGVQATTSNPPFARPLAVTGTVLLENAINVAGGSGVAPVTVDRDFDNSYVQSWNLNLQREIIPNLNLMIGYFGSKGTHLKVPRNINQPTNGVRPFPRLSALSPIFRAQAWVISLRLRVVVIPVITRSG
jgi:hypothetical protein